jgi:hypothetical protein
MEKKSDEINMQNLRQPETFGPVANEYLDSMSTYLRITNVNYSSALLDPVPTLSSANFKAKDGTKATCEQGNGDIIHKFILIQ